MKVPFVDLQAAYQAQKAEIDTAVTRVLSSGWYILGEEVQRFEKEFAAYCHSPFAIGVASGTDALLLAFSALDIGPGDEVITVAHSAVATAAAIELCGARPVFVDVDPLTYTLDPAQIEAAITSHTKAILPVHLYGHAANMDLIQQAARSHNLIVIEDNAQAHGARHKGEIVGGIAAAGAFSFYPTKNLGAIGDGGAILCRSEDVANRLQALRQYGWQQRYVSEEVGFNSRLDELQAAILRVKLRTLDEDNKRRRQAAAHYTYLLRDCPLILPQERQDSEHVYHLYVVQCQERDELQAYLAQKGIGTAIHYPVPIHRQPAYLHYEVAAGSLPITEVLANTVLSLPMFPTISAAQITAVAKAIHTFYGSD
jgi:dTDP-4-amino-4,6-dideoxygalactose transaminase